MKVTFLYPNSPISPHPSLEAWAMSVCQNKVKTSKGISLFDTEIPKTDILLLESLYCLPFAKKYKKKYGAKIVAMIVDTSFWKNKLSIFRKLYYKMYLDSVDAFITLSDRSKRDMQSFGIKKPIAVIRPFLVNKFSATKKQFNKNILFIGNEPEEKGYLKLIKAVKKMPEFDLYLVGNCCKKIGKNQPKNIHIECRVPSLKTYFEKCSYYGHPADFEPFGVAPLEAMYAGLIPILTKEVGLTEIFPGYLESILLINNKPETISAKIKELDALNKDEKLSIIQECKRLAMKYTKEKNIKEFEKEFYRLIKVIYR